MSLLVFQSNPNATDTVVAKPWEHYIVMMKYALRHSHIAVRAELPSLAKAAGATILTGEDELGAYSFFDMIVTDLLDRELRVRFASHDGDSMVHLLAERMDEPHASFALARALVYAGVSDKAKLSISTDNQGVPLRDEDEIQLILSVLLRPSESLRSSEPGKFGVKKKMRSAVSKGVKVGGRSPAMSKWSLAHAVVSRSVSAPKANIHDGAKRVPTIIRGEMVGHEVDEMITDEPVRPKPSRAARTTRGKRLKV